jgi:20S proteasome alpha/beta subunit
MTVGIGAVCDNGNATIVSADKMITFGSPMNLQVEPDTFKKIIEINERALLVFSGSTADGEEIIKKAKQHINSDSTINEIAEYLKLSYSQHKNKCVEDTILKPMLGADFKQFQNLIKQSSISQILQQILGVISQHNLKTDILLTGLDDSGAHIYLITHPGQLISLETMGFGTIGSGAIHAGVRMSLSRHTRNTPFKDTLYNVYEAKRASEVAPGVGKLTDMAVICKGKVYFLTDNDLKILEEVHKEKPILNGKDKEKLKEICNGFNGE